MKKIRLGGREKRRTKTVFLEHSWRNKSKYVWRLDLKSYDVVDSGGNIVGAEVGGEIKK